VMWKGERDGGFCSLLDVGHAKWKITSLPCGEVLWTSYRGIAFCLFAKWGLARL
jgi:hypothetical protein